MGDAAHYPLILTLHLLAVAAFLAGLMLAAASLPELTRAATLDGERRLELARLRAMGRYMTGPALLVVWACGIAMAVRGHWYASGWLQAKAALVLALSAVHGRQSLMLRQLGRGEAVAPASFLPVALIAAAVVAVIALVVEKP